MEILTFEELKLRMKVDARVIYRWRRQGMPCLYLPDKEPGVRKCERQTRYIWPDVLAWLKAQSDYPETFTTTNNNTKDKQ